MSLGVSRPSRASVPTLTVLGTSVTLQEDIRLRAEEDLGIRLKFIVLDGISAQRQAVTDASSFDVYDQWFHNLAFVWPARTLQPVDISAIEAWPEIGPLVKTGRLSPQDPEGKGINPSSLLYVQADQRLGREPSAHISMLPVTHNADSFGYLPRYLPEDLMNVPESWAWLLHPHFRKYVALQDDSSIGAIDAALAVQAAGLDHFADTGNLSIAEIDRLIACLTGLRRRGHFAAFWATVEESAALMTSGRVRIQSMWAPAERLLRDERFPFRMAAPVEGYRAWYGGLAISSRCTGRRRNVAYRYLNWWLSGWPGARMARQGYYLSVPGRVRSQLSEAEWDYWYGGQPAAEPLCDHRGQRLVARGDRRDGGAYEERMGRIAVWNSAMTEHNYLVRRWSEFCRGSGRASTCAAPSPARLGGRP